MPLIIPLLLAGAAAAAYAAFSGKKDEETPANAEVRTKAIGRPMRLTAAQVKNLRVVLNVLFGIIGKDRRLTKQHKANAAAIIGRFGKKGVAHAIVTETALPIAETWPGTTTNARDFVLKAYKVWLTQKAKTRTLPPTHKIPNKTVARKVAVAMRGAPPSLAARRASENQQRSGRGHF